jgi:RHS repeat-associated protein
VSSAGTESFLTDALGSTIALAGSTAKAETTYTYDPFGNTTKEGTASENPFQYAGRENDGDGLYYNRARYYSPVGARFISQDPLGQEANEPSGNVYLYAGDSPTNATDPYGTTNLKTPGPGGPGPGAGGTGGGGSGGGGAGGGGGGVGGGSAGGGFGPGPTPGGPGSGGCSRGSKGPGLAEAARCKSYEKLEQAEEGVRREREEEHPREESHGTEGSGLGDTFAGCAAGAAYLVEGGPLGMATGCLYGGTLGALGGDATGDEVGSPFLP